MDEVHPIPTNPKFQDLAGRKFGQWTVLRYAGKQKKAHQWLCECKCGTISKVSGANLGRASLSCGCLKHKRAAAKKQIHGVRRDAEYEAWSLMLARCVNTKRRDYCFYGGRGIRVCERWRYSFDTFYADMGPKPSTRSLDRINHDGDFEEANCRWVTAKQRQRNRRRRMLAYQGRTLCVAKWAKRLGVSRATLYNRIQDGWTVERAITTPVRRNKSNHLVTFSGKTLTVADWAELQCIPYATLAARLSRHEWSVERALTESIRGRRRRLTSQTATS